MATITLRVEGATVGIVETVVEITGADSDDILAAMYAAHGTDPEGNQRTPAEACKAAQLSVIRAWEDLGFRHRRDRAVEQAAAAVTRPTAVEI